MAIICEQFISYEQSISIGLNHIRHEAKLTDLTFVCRKNDQPSYLPAHKVIFAALSPHLKSLFEMATHKQPYEKVMVTLDSVEHVIMKKLIEYLYEGEIKVNNFERQKLIQLCALLQIEVPLSTFKSVAGLHLDPRDNYFTKTTNSSQVLNSGDVIQEDQLPNEKFRSVEELKEILRKIDKIGNGCNNGTSIKRECEWKYTNSSPNDESHYQCKQPGLSPIIPKNIVNTEKYRYHPRELLKFQQDIDNLNQWPEGLNKTFQCNDGRWDPEKWLDSMKSKDREIHLLKRNIQTHNMNGTHLNKSPNNRHARSFDTRFSKVYLPSYADNKIDSPTLTEERRKKFPISTESNESVDKCIQNDLRREQVSRIFSVVSLSDISSNETEWDFNDEAFEKLEKHVDLKIKKENGGNSKCETVETQINSNSLDTHQFKIDGSMSHLSSIEVSQNEMHHVFQATSSNESTEKVKKPLDEVATSIELSNRIDNNTDLIKSCRSNVGIKKRVISSKYAKKRRCDKTNISINSNEIAASDACVGIVDDSTNLESNNTMHHLVKEADGIESNTCEQKSNKPEAAALHVPEYIDEENDNQNVMKQKETLKNLGKHEEIDSVAENKACDEVFIKETYEDIADDSNSNISNDQLILQTNDGEANNDNDSLPSTKEKRKGFCCSYGKRQSKSSSSSENSNVSSSCGRCVAKKEMRVERFNEMKRMKETRIKNKDKNLVVYTTKDDSDYSLDKILQDLGEIKGKSKDRKGKKSINSGK